MTKGLMVVLLAIFMGTVNAGDSTARPGGLVNVRDFGAKGDGKSDDTEPLQRALDAAGRDPGAGRTVFLSSGQYKITRPLIVPLNVDIVGHGVGYSSTLVPSNSDGLHIVGESQKGGFAFRNKIQGVTINMQLSPKDKVAVLVDKAYTIKLTDLFIFEAGVGIRIRSARHVTLEDLSVYGKGSADAVGIEVTDSIVSAFNIDIEAVRYGLLVRESRPGMNNVSLFGGYIERFGAAGVLIDGATGTNLFGTTVIAQVDNRQTPVMIQRGPRATAACGRNHIIGGTFRYERPNNGRSPFLVEPRCVGNTIMAGDATP